MQEYGRWGDAAEELAAAGVPTTRKVHGPRKLGGGCGTRTTSLLSGRGEA